MKPKISVLVPLYNERENIERLVHEVGKVMQTLANPFELILVDDGSRDGSALLLRQMSRRFPYVKVILFRSNCGQTAALDAGFRHATGEIMITMDGDLQNDPADIPNMLQLLGQGYDLVAGYRHQRKDGLILRKIPSRIAN